jgi:hypothetical protein
MQLNRGNSFILIASRTFRLTSLRPGRIGEHVAVIYARVCAELTHAPIGRPLPSWLASRRSETSPLLQYFRIFRRKIDLEAYYGAAYQSVIIKHMQQKQHRIRLSDVDRETTQQIMLLREQGSSYRAIATTVGLSHGSVMRVVKWQQIGEKPKAWKASIPRRPRNGQGALPDFERVSQFEAKGFTVKIHVLLKPIEVCGGDLPGPLITRSHLIISCVIAQTPG